MNPAIDVVLGHWRIAPDLITLVTAGAVFGVTLWVSWLAWRRLATSPPGRRWGVLMLNLLAGSAVALLLLSPRLVSEADAAVTLFTEGAVGDLGDGQGKGPGGPRYVLGELDSQAFDEPPGDRLTQAGQLLLRQPDLASLVVLGHGLDFDDWRNLPPGVMVHFEPPALVGPVQLQWNTHLALGQSLTITGILRLETPEAVATLELLDPAGLTVATASARSGQSFALTTTPRGRGALEYRMRVVDGADIRSDEPVGVWVTEEQGARLMVIQSAPSFETRALTRWAADSGHALVVHSRISRERDLVQGVNLEQGSPLNRSASAYPGQDLVLMDGRRWAEMPARERETLLEAVRSGLGLVLMADAEFAAWLSSADNLALSGLALAPQPAREAVWPRWPGMDPEQSLTTAPFRLSWPGALTLTRDEAGEPLEAWMPLGEGRLMISLLRERHRWATRGETSTYSRYWARVLRQVARQDPGIRWLPPAADQRPRVAERLDLCATSPDARFVFGAMGSENASETRELVTPAVGANAHCGVVWPTQAGWHVARLVDADGIVQHEQRLRVYGRDEWRADRLNRREIATRIRANSVSSAGDNAGVRRLEQPLSPWWAWGLLLLAAGAPWLERRLFDLD